MVKLLQTKSISTLLAYLIIISSIPTIAAAKDGMDPTYACWYARFIVQGLEIIAATSFLVVSAGFIFFALFFFESEGLLWDVERIERIAKRAAREVEAARKARESMSALQKAMPSLILAQHWAGKEQVIRALNDAVRQAKEAVQYESEKYLESWTRARSSQELFVNVSQRDRALRRKGC